MNWKIGSHSFHISLTMLALAAGMLFVYAKVGPSAAVTDWLALAHQEATTVHAWKAQATQLTARADHARASAAFFQDSMGALEAVYDSLLAVAQKPGSAITVTQIGAACQATITACQHRGDSLAVADSLDRIRAEVNFARAVHADSVLALGVKVTSCKFLLLFPCPSREQAFLGGGGVATVLYLLLRH